MSLRLWPALMLVAALLLTVPGQRASAQAPLAWTLKKGDQFYVRTVTTTKQTLKAGGKEVGQDLQQTIVLGFLVEDHKADGVVLRQTIEGLTVKSGSGEAVADERVRGAVLTVTLSPRLEVLKIEGQDKLIDRLAGDEAGVRRSLQAVLGNEEALKRTVRELFGFLPEKSPKEGETWERSVDVPFGPLGMLRQTTTYKREGQEDRGGRKLERIGTTIGVEYRAGKASPALPFHVVSGEVKSEGGQGKVLFDAAAGRLAEAESKVTLQGRMILSVGGANVDAEVRQEQTSTTSVSGDKPPQP